MKPKKSKSKFKQKLKNFFNVDIEKDLQEEEPSPNFKRIKLFTLTRTNIFLGLFLFLLVINALIIFDVNIIYLRQILGFLFLVSVPGLILMLCFKIRNTGFWEYLVYTVGLSISFIMFAGLLVNWTLPWLGITDKPLSLYPILICFDIFLIVLGIVAFKRNKDFKSKLFTVPKLDRLNNIFFIIPMLFPVLSILGAFLLNNHGPNILTMIMLGGIAVYVLLLTIFRKRLDKNIWPWAIWMISISILLSWSLASWHISGWDVHQEYLIFKLTDNANYWSMNLYPNNAYNACVSLNILPKIFLNYIPINSEFIFKFLFQITFSFISIVLFLIFKRIINNNLSFLSTLFFCVNTQFIIYAGWIRQEFAILFFALSFLILFSKKINQINRSILFLIFGFSIVLSHYSTNYIALSILIFFSIFLLLSKKLKKNDFRPYLVIFILIVLSFLWLFQITQISGGVVHFTENSISQFNKFGDSANRQSGISLFNQLKISKSSQSVTSEEINLFYNEVGKIYSENPNLETYASNKYSDLGFILAGMPLMPLRFNNVYGQTILFYNLINLLPKILLAGGVILFLLFYKKKDKDYLILSLISFSLIILITIVPFASLNYSARRLYQQTLIILSPMILFPFIYLNKIFKTKIFLIFSALFLVTFLLFTTGFVQEIIGGFPPSNQLSQDKTDFVNFGFTYPEEYYSSRWLGKNSDKKYLIYSDDTSAQILKSSGLIKNKIYFDVFQNTLDRNAYVFLNVLNVYGGISQLHSEWSFQKKEIFYKFPTKFLNDNKNKIYNNGGSEIFK